MRRRCTRPLRCLPQVDQSLPPSLASSPGRQKGARGNEPHHLRPPAPLQVQRKGHQHYCRHQVHLRAQIRHSCRRGQGGRCPPFLRGTLRCVTLLRQHPLFLCACFILCPNACSLCNTRRFFVGAAAAADGGARWHACRVIGFLLSMAQEPRAGFPWVPPAHLGGPGTPEALFAVAC